MAVSVTLAKHIICHHVACACVNSVINLRNRFECRLEFHAKKIVEKISTNASCEFSISRERHTHTPFNSPLNWLRYLKCPQEFPSRNDRRNDNLLGAQFSGQTEPKENIEYIFVPFYTRSETAIRRNRCACRHCRQKKNGAAMRLLNATVTFAHVNLLFCCDRCDTAVAAAVTIISPPSTFYILHFILVSSLRRAPCETQSWKKKIWSEENE